MAEKKPDGEYVGEFLDPKKITVKGEKVHVEGEIVDGYTTDPHLAENIAKFRKSLSAGTSAHLSLDDKFAKGYGDIFGKQKGNKDEEDTAPKQAKKPKRIPRDSMN